MNLVVLYFLYLIAHSCSIKVGI